MSEIKRKIDKICWFLFTIFMSAGLGGLVTAITVGVNTTIVPVVFVGIALIFMVIAIAVLVWDDL